jgi:hypothetical protein
MSFRSGDRARAHKINRKRRFRRSEMRLLRRVTTPVPDERHASPIAPPVRAKA